MPFRVASLIVAAAFLGAAAAQEPLAPAGPTMLSAAYSPEGLAKTRLARFDALLEEATRKEDFIGLAVAVVSGGEVAMLRTYGVTETEGDRPVTPNTVFRIASLSKGFAASLAALAMEENKLRPDAAVAPFAPRFTLKGDAQKQLTIEHILSHRVGLPPNAYDNLLEDGVPVADILPRYRTVAPICRVGTCYGYQNVSFNIISDVLAGVYGAPYEDLVSQRIFEPLGMRNASFGREALTSAGDWARSYTRKRVEGAADVFGPWEVASVKDAYYRTPAAGGVNASITDMAKWLAAQMGRAPDVLPPAALARLHAPVVETLAETRRWNAVASRISTTHYGLGWRIYDYAGETVVTHSGSVEGYGAQIAFLPERDVGIVLLSNTRTKRVFRILPAFLDNELGLEGADWLELTTDRTLADSGDETRAAGED